MGKTDIKKGSSASRLINEIDAGESEIEKHRTTDVKKEGRRSNSRSSREPGKADIIKERKEENIKENIEEKAENKAENKEESEERTGSLCFNAAMKLLSYGDRSELELVKRLAQKGFDRAQIRAALEILKNKGYVNDLRLMQIRIVYLANKKLYGQKRIDLELLCAFGRESVLAYRDAALAYVKEDIDFFENARAFAKVYKDRGKDKIFILSKLKERGFSFEQAEYALETEVNRQN